MAAVGSYREQEDDTELWHQIARSITVSIIEDLRLNSSLSLYHVIAVL